MFKRATVATFLVVAGCGGNKNSSVDASADARLCNALTSGTVDFASSDPTNMYISWTSSITGSVGDGNELDLTLEFYGTGAPITGTVDLTASPNNDYGTCITCVSVYDVSGGEVSKTFFQSAGSLTLSEDPVVAGHIKGAFSGLQVEEVTIDQDTFASTPVAGGACGSIADFNLDHGDVPNSWTCDAAKYNDGVTCDCMCGADPDCEIMAAPVAGCASVSQVCYDDACVTPPANDTCATAAAITVNGAAVMGTTVNAADNYDAGLDGASCTNLPQAGPDVAYAVALTLNEHITVTLSNVESTYDAGISLVGPGTASVCTANPIATCVAGADMGAEGEGETFTYTAATAGTYYLIIDSYYPDEAGTFTLAVTSP